MCKQPCTRLFNWRLLQTDIQRAGSNLREQLAGHRTARPTHLLPPAAPLPPPTAAPPSAGLEDRWRPPGEEGRGSE